MSVFDYNFEHEKYGEGACAAVITMGGNPVTFTSVHVNTSMRQHADAKDWAIHLREAISEHGANITREGPVVVMGDFNADLASPALSDSLKQAGWSVGNVVEPEFTTE